MSVTQPPDEFQPAAREADRETEAAEAATAPGDARGRTWAHGMPAMRMQRTRWRLSGGPAAAARGEAAGTSAVGPARRFALHTRFVRAMVGLGLLVLAWLGALAIYMLARAAIEMLGSPLEVAVVARGVITGLAACFLIIVEMGLVVVAAFALALAMHPNDPPMPSPTAEDGARM
jgi:hypothetical protein